MLKPGRSRGFQPYDPVTRVVPTCAVPRPVKDPNRVSSIAWDPSLFRMPGSLLKFAHFRADP